MFLAGLSIILEKSYIVIKTLNPNLTDVPLKFGCFIHEPSIIKLIAYMKEPSGFKSSFEGLYSFSVHERNFRYRNLSFFNGCAPSFLNNVSHENNSNSYDLRNHKELYSTNLRIVRYGTGTVSYAAPKTWSKVPETIKMTSFFKSFK